MFPRGFQHDKHTFHKGLPQGTGGGGLYGQTFVAHVPVTVPITAAVAGTASVSASRHLPSGQGAKEATVGFKINF